MDKAEDGKNKVITDRFSSPLFDPRFIFEMLINFELISVNGEGGFVIPRKITHPSVRAILPKPDQQIGIAFGEALARWCVATGESKSAASANFDVLRQATDGRSDALTVLNDVTIKNVTTSDGKKKDGTAYTVFWVILSDDQKYGTLNKTIGDLAMREIGTGLQFCAKVRSGKKEGTFELVELEQTDLIP